MNRKTKISCKDILGYLLLGISAVMLGRSLMLCFSNDIWYDELFTVGMIEHSYGELVGLTARDVHPPLYYIITKFIVDLCKLIAAGTSTVAAAKTVSVLPYFVLLVYSATLLRKRFGIFTGGLFLFCSIAMPQLSGYTVEVRMYSWALLFVTAAFLHAYASVHVCGTAGTEAEDEAGSITGDKLSAPDAPAGRRQGDPAREGFQTGGNPEKGRKTGRMQRLHGAAMVCYGLAAAYTQYFACVAVIMVYLYVLLVLIRKQQSRIKEWFLWAAVSVTGYVPWLFVLYQQITEVNAGYWILPLSWRTFGGCVKFLMKPAFTNDVLNTVLAVVMFLIYAGVLAYNVIKICCHGREKRKNTVSDDIFNRNKFFNDKRKNAADNSEDAECMARVMFMIAGTGVPAGVVLFGFTASMLVRPIFVYRYMIPAAGCFWLSFALGLNDMWGGIFRKDSSAAGRRPGRLSAVIVLCVMTVGLRDYRAFMGEEEYKILLMKQTKEALSSIAADDIIIYNFDQVQAVTSWYLPEEADSYLWCGTPEALIQDIIRPYGTVEDTATLKSWCEDGRTVWFIGSFNSRDAVVEEWAAEGLKIEETGSYLLERYWFNLYKIYI